MSFAAGSMARANHNWSFVWHSPSTDGDDSLTTTASHQFLIGAPSGVGINTDSPASDLTVAGDANIDGALGINTAIMTADLTVNGDANIDGPVGIGTAGPGSHLHVKDYTATDNGGSLSGYVSSFENTRTTGGDGIAIKIGNTSVPDAESNFIGFFTASGLIGEIEGNGSGGVQLTTPGADYAEHLQRVNRNDVLAAGEVVGVIGGRISHDTNGADQVMVITDRAAVAGNMPKDREAAAEFETVSFIGQIPVLVAGLVSSGDYIIASGNHDGAAVAVHPHVVTLEDVNLLVGRAWEDNRSTGLKRVNTVVGLDRSEILAAILKRQEERIETLEQKLDSLFRMLDGDTVVAAK